jgi:transposase, IS5 family
MPSIRRLQLRIEDFITEFDTKLDPNNEIAKLAEIIDWDLADTLYNQKISDSDKNTNSKDSRMAFGALILQVKYNFSDRMLIQMIAMNPYFQFFIGMDRFEHTCPFSQATLVSFRKRISMDMINQVNELLCKDEHDDESTDDNNRSTKREGQSDNEINEKHENQFENKGTLILDATCVPQDIKYPTDWDLLNSAREKLEAIIDYLHEPMRGIIDKVRTYRQKARKSFLSLSKSKKKSHAKIRKVIRYQLECLNRNLKHIKEMALTEGYNQLTPKQTWNIIVINELYRQQKFMYDQNTRTVEDRIVSLHSPHIRPIVRGKMKATVEFGAKLSVSVVNGYTYIEKLSWDSFNEGQTLIESIENYKERFGHYPKQVLVDKIYRTRVNIRQLNELEIKITGPKLGRPKVGEIVDKVAERLAEAERNIVEGKFGESKRKHSLDCLMAKTKETSETVIALTILVMNLNKKLRLLFIQFLKSVIFTLKYNSSISYSV